MEIFKGDALTVGQLRAAIANIPDDVEIGHGNLSISGYAEKVVRLALVKGDNGSFIVFDGEKGRAGTFTEDELGEGEDVEICRVQDEDEP